MKRLFVFLLSFYICCTLSAQKEDYNWVMGNLHYNEPEDKTGMVVNFEGERTYDVVGIGGDMDGNSTTISSSEGEFLFYANGCHIFNKEHRIMENGDSINAPGMVFDDACLAGGGYYGQDLTLILPDPAERKGYYYLHTYLIFDYEKSEARSIFYYSYVDFTEEELGRVTEKQVELLPESKYGLGYLTACRHANKKDWWVLMNKDSTNIYYKFLIDERGMNIVDTMDMGHPELFPEEDRGQAVFSPDGSMYAVHTVSGLMLYDFDRETGDLSNYRSYEVGSQEKNYNAYVGFSSTSRFLYASTGHYLYQLDMEEEGEEDFIALVDTTRYPTTSGYPHFFSLMRLGPDCKMYSSVGNGVEYINIIHHPDRKGEACGVEQNVLIPVYNGIRTMPNFPHYRMDEEEKCDSSIVSSVPYVSSVGGHVRMYPNPTADYLYIQGYSGVARVLDISGRVHMEEEVDHRFPYVNIKGLRSGIYFLRLENGQSHKVIKM